MSILIILHGNNFFIFVYIKHKCVVNPCIWLVSHNSQVMLGLKPASTKLAKSTINIIRLDHKTCKLNKLAHI